MQSSISTFNTEAEAAPDADDDMLPDGDFDAAELFTHDDSASGRQETSHR